MSSMRVKLCSPGRYPPRDAPKRSLGVAPHQYQSCWNCLNTSWWSTVSPTKYGLKSESAQRAALDRYAGHKLAEVLDRYRELFGVHQRRLAELEELTINREAKRVEAERLRDALERIESVRPLPGEDATLRALSDRLESLEKISARPQHWPRRHSRVTRSALSPGMPGVWSTRRSGP